MALVVECVFLLVLWVSKVKGSADICTTQVTGKLLPDLDNCHNFIQCVHGRSQVMKCAANLYFNPVGSYCDYQGNVKCPGNRCNLNNGGCQHSCVYLDNNNYACACQSGFKLDMDRKSCIPGSLNMATYCSNRHGEQLPDPLQCNGFIKCQGSRSVKFSCGAGLVYNTKAKVCDWKFNFVCPGQDFNAWVPWTPCFRAQQGCIRQRTRHCKAEGVYCEGVKWQVEQCKETECDTTRKVNPCEIQNGGCSDICRVDKGKAVCLCDKRRVLTNDGKTCTKETCGVAFLRNNGLVAHIVSGQIAMRGGYPWQAGIYKLIKEDDGQVRKLFHCGGTLIDGSHVVSAAHCFNNKKPLQYQIVLGDHDRNKNEGSEQFLNLADIIVHKDYNSTTLQDDIALLTLDKNAKTSHFITPLCLPQDNEELKPGTSCRVTGWGKKNHISNAADVLQEITVPVVSEKRCKKKNNMNMQRDIPRVTSTNVCTGYDTGRDFRSACHQDSGGPLSCMSGSGVWKLYGVVSWGDSQCIILNKYNVFTKVSKYTTWIRENMA